jgi:hypothetical protein
MPIVEADSIKKSWKPVNRQINLAIELCNFTIKLNSKKFGQDCMDRLQTTRLRAAEWCWCWIAFYVMLALCSLLSRGSEAQSPPSEPTATTPLFVDVTEKAGLHWLHHSGGPEKWHILKAKGGGVAFLDFDGYGYLDIYLVNGANLENTNKKEPGRNALYRNLGNGRFIDVTYSRSGGRYRLGNGVRGSGLR